MLARPRVTALHLSALENIQAWTRYRFKLAPDAPVLVAEVACRLSPHAPRLETAVAFWTADKRHQFKLSKPVLEVVYDDIGWLIGSPADHEAATWDCC
jgi:hypothetical protein